jgi:chromosome segregation ATPase
MTLTVLHHHYFHTVPQTPSEEINLLKKILTKTENIMSKATEVEAKIDALQSKLDTEQEEVLASVAELKAEIQSLKDIIAGGATDNEALDRSIAKLDAIASDLESTVTPTPTEPTPEA